MPTILVDDPDDPRLGDDRDVPDPVLLRDRGVFIAESRLVVRELLAHPSLETRSLLVTEAALASLGDLLAARSDDLPIYVGAHRLLARVVGFGVHRGCLAAGDRPARVTDAALPQLRAARTVVVLEAVANPDNVGGIFRNAAAFGVECVLMSSRCCDPLYRKAIRTSIGATLRTPYAYVEDWPEGLSRLRDAGFTIVALTPDSSAVDIETFAAVRPERLALLFGSEGPGLSACVARWTDASVQIPIAPGINSLNVATASGIALHRMSTTGAKRRGRVP